MKKLDHKDHKRIKNNPSLKATSVRVHESLLTAFKISSVTTKISLQSLVNRSINLFVNNVEFRNKITSHTDLLPSGSL